MNKFDFSKLTLNELRSEILKMKKHIAFMRCNASLGNLKDTASLSKARKNVARACTALNCLLRANSN